MLIITYFYPDNTCVVARLGLPDIFVDTIKCLWRLFWLWIIFFRTRVSFALIKTCRGVLIYRPSLMKHGPFACQQPRLGLEPVVSTMTRHHWDGLNLNLDSEYLPQFTREYWQRHEPDVMSQTSSITGNYSTFVQLKSDIFTPCSDHWFQSLWSLVSQDPRIFSTLIKYPLINFLLIQHDYQF